MNNNSPWRKVKAVKCCKDCKPPKRYPGCGANCKKYKEEKAEYLAKKQREKEYLETHPVIKKSDFNKL